MIYKRGREGKRNDFDALLWSWMPKKAPSVSETQRIPLANVTVWCVDWHGFKARTIQVPTNLNCL